MSKELPCIKCGEAGHLWVAADDARTITCTSCDGEYEVSEVRDMIGAWGPVLDWIDAHPSKKKPEGP